jgi:phosphoribosylformylglycinamidine synthase
MARANICVLRAPGTNCDVETAFAFERAGGRADSVHLFRLLERPAMLLNYQIICIPGGFSYGDDVGAGKVFAAQLRAHVKDTIAEILQSDRLMLGICNGFQVLLQAGILPGGADSGWTDTPPQVTLTWNDNGRYTVRWVELSVPATPCVFLRDMERIELPVAHAEGRIAVRNPGILADWRQRGQIAMQYGTAAKREAVSPECRSPAAANPNGSAGDVAGISDPTGRVLGLMPHPERFIDATQHPQWTRRRLQGDGEGLRLFRNAVEYFA